MSPPHATKMDFFILQKQNKTKNGFLKCSKKKKFFFLNFPPRKKVIFLNFPHKNGFFIHKKK